MPWRGFTPHRWPSYELPHPSQPGPVRYSMCGPRYAVQSSDGDANIPKLDSNEDYYSVLEATADSTPRELKRAYYKMVGPSLATYGYGDHTITLIEHEIWYGIQAPTPMLTPTQTRTQTRTGNI